VKLIIVSCGVASSRMSRSPEWLRNASDKFINSLLTALGLADQTRFTEFEDY
jgi:hypothetical protein